MTVCLGSQPSLKLLPPAKGVANISVAVDNGEISPVIQSTNQSRVTSSGPRADVCPEGKETRSNPELKVEQKR